MRTISCRQLRNNSAAILRDVQGGERIVVTRDGTPVAELGPILRRQFVPRSAITVAARTAPRIDFARFRADLDTVTNPSPR